MGLTKRLWEKSQEKGYVAPERLVCGRCVDNQILREVLDDAESAEECSYCGSDGAAPIWVLLDEISDAAFWDYTDPANELPYDGREGGYQGEVLESDELIFNLGEWTRVDALYEDVRAAFSDSVWCRRHYLGVDPNSRLHYGWVDFVRQIKHKTRYLFLQENREEDYEESISPGRMLDEVGVLLETMVRVIPAGLEVYRARVVKMDDHPLTPDELGTPPAKLAQQDNRMSPAGIPMFYGALDEDTAVVETFDPMMGRKRRIVVGRWRTMRDMVVLDLSELPELPDPFDSTTRTEIPRIAFLHDFVRDLTKPVDRGLSSIEYVPTQVVTEYVRHRMKSGNKGIDAIKYRSSKPTGSIALVLFAERKNCLAPGEQKWPKCEQLVSLCEVQFRDPNDFEHLSETA